MKIIGAGLGRTGTLSLKLAISQLSGEPCYHMTELWRNEGHLERWHDIVRGGTPDWNTLFAGFTAVVDWPACAFWEPLAAEFPEAVVLLSTRSDADTWFDSASSTIFEESLHAGAPDSGFAEMQEDMLKLTFDGNYRDRAVAVAGYEQHNAYVRANCPPERLVEYQPGDGWAPICAALDLPIPDEPFPHTNSTDDFRSRAGLDK